MRRIGDLLPEAASALGLEEELRLARAMSAWQRIVDEHVPAACGTSRLIEVRGDTALVSAPSSLIAAELRLRASALLAILGSTPGAPRVRQLQVVVRPDPHAGQRDAHEGHRDGAHEGGPHEGRAGPTDPGDRRG
jgi:predicted nucleic acid-binding Zn ribbon protein